MYKIYINENELILQETESIKDKKSTKGILIAPYNGKTKLLLSYVDMLEKTNRFEKIIIHFKDLKQLKNDFESLFKVIRASGGLVKNELGETLFIFRRGFWDLPKGKIDMGEKKKAAAIREVEEETGIKSIELGKKFYTTRHVYKLSNGRRALKKSFWYAMKAPNQKLIPQTAEDITEAKWLKFNQIYNSKRPIYKNIEDVMEAFKSQKAKKNILFS